MKFSYYKFSLPKADPVDDSKFFYRPMLPIEVELDGKSVVIDALIDSGADYNMAPIEMAGLFDLYLAKYPKVHVGGIEQTKQIELSIVPLVMRVGGHPIKSYLGFGGDLPTVLLGQKGFFDRFKQISFQHPKYVEIK